MNTTKIFIIAVCILWIVTGITCFTSEFIDKTSKPTKSDISSITKCSDELYNQNSNFQLNLAISGTWYTPTNLVIFDTDGHFYILEDTIILESGNYLANSNGILNMYTNSTGASLPMCGKIYVCHDLLYNTSLNEIWKFKCKCYI